MKTRLYPEHLDVLVLLDFTDRREGVRELLGYKLVRRRIPSCERRESGRAGPA